MRTIQVTNEVYGKIWSLSEEGEKDESEILKRVLSHWARGEEPDSEPDHVETRTIKVSSHERTITIPRQGKITWIDDVALALDWIGGKGHLSEIYRAVRKLRKKGGRSLPPSIEAVIRKTLEENSSHSSAYKGRYDLFSLPEGKGRGIWALRYAKDS